MLIKPASDIRSSEITDKKLYLNRREFIRATTATAARPPHRAGPGGRRGGRRAGRRGVSAGGPRAARAQARERPEEPAEHRRKGEQLGSDYELQQLLRVRHRP